MPYSPCSLRGSQSGWSDEEPDQRGLADRRWYRCWRGIDREQRQIIQDEYDDIWNHSLATKLFVTAAGFTAVDPSGGPSFLDHMLTPNLISANLQIPGFPGQTHDISIDIDGLDLSANVANEEDRMKWIVEVVNAYMLDRWHNDPDGLAAQTQLELLAEVERYRQIPSWARP